MLNYVDRLDPGYTPKTGSAEKALAAIKKKFLEGCDKGKYNYGYIIVKPTLDPDTWYAEVDYDKKFLYDPENGLCG